MSLHQDHNNIKKRNNVIVSSLDEAGEISSNIGQSDDNADMKRLLLNSNNLKRNGEFQTTKEIREIFDTLRNQYLREIGK